MKFKVGTEVIINNTAPVERNAAVTFVYDMERQLGKRGKGTEVVINNKAPTNRLSEITFEYEMERQPGKRGTIIECQEFRSINIYLIQTEDGKKWWYRT